MPVDPTRKAILVLLIAIAAFMLYPGQSQTWASDYTYRDGYYWRDGQAYTRTRYTRPGCCYSSWKYTRACPPAAATAAKKPAGEDPFGDAILQYAQTVRKWKDQEAQRRTRHNERMELIRELLPDDYDMPEGAKIDRSNPYRINGGSGDPFGNRGGPINYNLSQRAAQQGSSDWAYRVDNQVADLYRNVDLMSNFNQAFRLASDQVNAADKSRAGVMDLVNQFNDGVRSILDKQIALEETKAKAAGIAEISRAAGEAIKAESRAYIARFSSGGPTAADPAVAKLAAAGKLDKPELVLSFRCASCHAPGGSAAHFDLRTWPTDRDRLESISARLRTRDKAKRMPPEGHDLPAAERKVLIKAADVDELDG